MGTYIIITIIAVIVCVVIYALYSYSCKPVNDLTKSNTKRFMPHWVKPDYIDNDEFDFKDGETYHRINISSVIIGKRYLSFKRSEEWQSRLVGAIIDNTCRDMLKEYGLPPKDWFMNSLRERINGRLMVAHAHGTLPHLVQVEEITMKTKEMEC